MPLGKIALNKRLNYMIVFVVGVVIGFDKCLWG